MHHSTARHIKLHMQRFTWFSLVIAGLLLVQIFSGTQPQQGGVLGQTSDLSNQALLSGTNKERTKNNLGELQLNSNLSKAASAKAADMVKKDYWSHNTPDGKTPWYFIESVGYEYINAGENLAYGFKTNEGVINGWMNSQKHRDNVLGDYKDVGFGYANSDNFQGGSYTVVVAMYGTNLKSTIAASASNEPGFSFPVPSENTTQEGSRVLAWKAIANASAPLSLYASLSIMAIAAAGFVSTHRKLLKHSWERGLKYAHMHPLVDAAILSAITAAIVTSSIGFIK
jgi:uncharacterized protein YkwD